MVEAGWDFTTLMQMRPGEFAFWLGARLSLEKMREKEREKARAR